MSWTTTRLAPSTTSAIKTMSTRSAWERRVRKRTNLTAAPSARETATPRTDAADRWHACIWLQVGGSERTPQPSASGTLSKVSQRSQSKEALHALNSLVGGV